MTWGWLRSLIKWAAPVVGEVAKTYVEKKIGAPKAPKDS